VLAPRFEEAAVLERVVHQLRQIESRAGLQRVSTIGELLLRTFFSGNQANWRDRRRNKNNSLRRLAARADCPLSKSALNEAIVVYVTLQSLQEKEFRHVLPGHISAVAPLVTVAQAKLLKAVEAEKLSVRELRQRVVAERQAGGERRGRPATLQATELTALQAMRRATARVGAAREALVQALDIKTGHALRNSRAWVELRTEFAVLTSLIDGKPEEVRATAAE
jgi:hypothetical protein